MTKRQREKVKQEYESEKEELINQIGQLTVDMNWLKKTTTGLRVEEKKALIDFDSKELTVKHQCELLNLSRSTSYYETKVHKPNQEETHSKMPWTEFTLMSLHMAVADFGRY